jgi:hypothetical protein
MSLEQCQTPIIPAIRERRIGDTVAERRKISRQGAKGQREDRRTADGRRFTRMIPSVKGGQSRLRDLCNFCDFFCAFCPFSRLFTSCLNLCAFASLREIFSVAVFAH